MVLVNGILLVFFFLVFFVFSLHLIFLLYIVRRTNVENKNIVEPKIGKTLSSNKIYLFQKVGLSINAYIIRIRIRKKTTYFLALICIYIK